MITHFFRIFCISITIAVVIVNTNLKAQNISLNTTTITGLQVTNCNLPSNPIGIYYQTGVLAGRPILSLNSNTSSWQIRFNTGTNQWNLVAPGGFIWAVNGNALTTPPLSCCGWSQSPDVPMDCTISQTMPWTGQNNISSIANICVNTSCNNVSGSYVRSSSEFSFSGAVYNGPNGNRILKSGNSTYVLVNSANQVLYTQTVPAGATEPVLSNSWAPSGSCTNNQVELFAGQCPQLMSTGCVCNNDQNPNENDGTFGTTLILRRMGGLPQSIPFVITMSNRLENTDGSPLQNGTPLIFCGGIGCPTGVMLGDYYLNLNVTSSTQPFSATVNSSYSTGSVNCNVQYPSVPIIQIDDLLCLTGITQFPSSGGIFSINYQDVIDNDPAILFSGFSQEGNGNLFIDPDFLFESQSPYEIYLTVESNGCFSTASKDLEIYKSPQATLESKAYQCFRESAPFLLNDLFVEGTTTPGFFTYQGEVLDTNRFQIEFMEAGCFPVIYTATHPRCPSDVSEANFYVSLSPAPHFNIEDSRSPVCLHGNNTETINITRTSTGPNPGITVVKSPANSSSNFEIIGDINDGGIQITFTAPEASNSVIYRICLNERTSSISDLVCEGIPPVDSICENTFCRTFTIYNDGYDCGNNNLFNTCPEPYKPDPCPITISPSFEVNCVGSFVTNIFLAYFPDPFFIELEEEKGLYSCQEDSIGFNYRVSLIPVEGVDGNLEFLTFIGANTSLSDIIPGHGLICRILNFCLTFNVPVINKTIHLGCPLEEIAEIVGCGKTIAQFIIGLTQTILGDGAGKGTLVVADTNGDGFFDYIVDQGPLPSNMPNTVYIPNRIDGEGYVTIRAIGAWPQSPKSFCGEVSSAGIDLLDAIPIGVIPWVGPPVEFLLKFLQCDIPFQFSSEKTVQIPVRNFEPPSFVSCNEDGFLFSQTLDCEIPVTWSIPVAFTSCDEKVLAYRGVTSFVVDEFGQFYDGPSSNINPVELNQAGVYQIAGPIPGSLLPPGDYEVTYRAVGCNGNPQDCTFGVKVRPGEPILQCPRSITVPTDVDECTAVVTGLSPLQGIGCVSIINYSLTNPVSGTIIETNSTGIGENNSPDGYAFELGVTPIVYTMLIDKDGDGNFDGPGETQSCQFTVTVRDRQRPQIQCVDVTGQLDNNGHLTVFANVTPNQLFIDGGSFDNCDPNLTLEISRGSGDYGPSALFQCADIGTNYVNLRATDDSGNQAFCRASVVVIDFFEGFVLNLDLPEICFEPFQDSIDFSPYIVIARPDGTIIPHSSYSTLGPDIVGGFGISGFVPDPGSTDDPGEISQDGVYRLGTGTGWITVSYVLAIGEQINEINGPPLQGCFIMVHNVLRIEKLDPVWEGGFMCCDQLPIWLGGATWDGPEDGDPSIPPGMLSLRDIRGDYPGDAFGRWTGQGVSFQDPDGVPFSGDEFYMFDPQGLDGTYTLTYHVGDEPCINIWSQDIRVTCQELQVDLSDITVCPANLVEERVVLVNLDDKDLVVSTTGFAALAAAGAHYGGGPDLDPVMDLMDVPVVNGRVVIPAFYAPAVRDEDFEICVEVFQTTPFGCAEIRCYTITVQDLEEPKFINCPREPIVEDAAIGICGAFVNFSNVVAVDNCMGLGSKLEQVDTTGLKSGDLFPVGTTILAYTAIDTVGNQNYCEIKVVVVDFQQTPTIVCGADIERVNDPGECGAVINQIPAPEFDDNCPDNTSLVYSVTSESGELIGCGFEGVNGQFFPVGVNTVEFKVYDQPLILITEVVQDGIIAGMEITNFGPAAVDITCSKFIMKDEDGNILEMFTVPSDNNIATMFQRPIYPPVIPILWNVNDPGNILMPGEVYTHIFNGDQNGNGEIDVENNYDRCNVRRYCFAFLDNIIDEAVINDEVVGDVILRKNICDTDEQSDFIPATACDPGSFGMLNPGLPFMPWNGTQTGLQSFKPLEASCSINVTITDVEGPVCIWHDSISINSALVPAMIGGEECFISGINMPGGIVDDVNIKNLRIATMNAGAFTVYLRSPQGTRILLMQRQCAIDSDYCNGSGISGFPNIDINLDNTINKWEKAPGIEEAPCSPLGQAGIYHPLESFDAFAGEEGGGIWTLEIYTDEGETGVLDSWELEILYNIPFGQDDVVLENAPGLCSQDFEWVHPILQDNCLLGAMTVTYTFNNPDTGESDTMTEVISNLENSPSDEGCKVMRTFKVGITEVEYMLIDQYGNRNICGFTVTVEDVEDPTIVCPDDIVIQLEGGECRRNVCYAPQSFDDNCQVVEILYSIPPCTAFEIGITEVTITAVDQAGNESSCEFTVEILEYVPGTTAMICNGNINISLDHTCEIELHPDMLLEGGEYRCYEDYIVIVSSGAGVPIPTSPRITIEYEGQTLMYTVLDPETGNSCWGFITIEVKAIPIIECPADTVILCSSSKDARDALGRLILGEVQLLTCKPNVSITYEDVVNRDGICDDPVATIHRTFTVSDLQNNFVTCTQIIEVVPFNFDQVVWPQDALLSCGDVARNPQLTHPNSLGYPTIDGIIVDEVNAICNLSHTYEDQVLWICGNTYEIIRKWFIRNRCLPLSPANPIVHYQLIEVLDWEAPKFHSCPDEVVINTGPWDCNGSAQLPVPETIKDGCSDVEFKAYIYGSGSIEVNGTREGGDLSVRVRNVNKNRQTRVKYIVYDACGNESSCIFNVKVLDLTPPVAISLQNVVVSLVPGGPDVDGNAKLYAHQLDNGSFDNCGPVKLEIRRDESASTCENEGLNNHNNNLTYNNDGHSGDDPNDTDGGEFVKFCCADLNTEIAGSPGPGYHMVWMRVWDDGDANGVFGSAGDNYNETWSWVKVEDKQPPVIQCPDDMTIACDWPIDESTDFGGGFQNTDLARFDKTGFPTMYTTCPQDLLTEFQDRFTAIPAGNNCGLGRLVRTFRATKQSTAHGSQSPVSVICTQIIDIESTASTQQWVVTAPPSSPVKGMPCAGPTQQQILNAGPTWVQGPCDVIGENIKVDTFLFEDGVCKKWVAEYNYMNWCTGEAQGPYYRDFVYEDEIKPEFTECVDTCYGVDANCSLTGLRLQKTATDEGGCTDQGWLKWQVFVDLWADGTIDYEFTSFVPPGTNREIVVDGVPRRQIYVAPTLNGAPLRGQGNQLGILIPEDIGSKLSKHKVEWKVTDGCHNHQVCVEHFTVEDKKAPTPYCVHLSTALMDNGMVELWAKDFDFGSFDNCTAQQDLVYTFDNWAPQLDDTIIGGQLINSSVAHYFNANGFVTRYPTTNQSVLNMYNQGNLQVWLPGFNSSAKAFTCDDLAQAVDNKVEVVTTVWDKSKNSDFCVTQLTLIDNNGACGTGNQGRIEGYVYREDGAKVQEAAIHLHNELLPEYPRVQMSNENGKFVFNNVVKGLEYELEAIKNTNPVNGVNTLDLVLIQRHILGIETLDSPYKILAADVNNTNSVQVSDLVTLRRLILGAIDDFPNNSSWIFVDADYQFSDNQQPWEGKEQGIAGISAELDVQTVDFIAIKIGDVNNTAHAGLTGAELETRTSEKLVFTAEDRVVTKGELVEIPISGKNFVEVYGFQFTAAVKGLKLVDVRSGALNAGMDNTAVHENSQMTMSWHSTGMVTEADNVLFTWVFQVTEGGLLSEKIRLHSAITPAQSYLGSNMQISGVELEFRSSISEREGYVLEQNQPNPFRDKTVVNYSIPESAEVKFTVFDISGRVLLVKKLDATAGWNQVEFNKDELSVPGVLIYQMESGDFISNRKMILIE
jgi:subtilisin-like proprotein convertase family protein